MECVFYASIKHLLKDPPICCLRDNVDENIYEKRFEWNNSHPQNVHFPTGVSVSV